MDLTVNWSAQTSRHAPRRNDRYIRDRSANGWSTVKPALDFAVQGEQKPTPLEEPRQVDSVPTTQGGDTVS